MSFPYMKFNKTGNVLGTGLDIFLGLKTFFRLVESIDERIFLPCFLDYLFRFSGLKVENRTWNIFYGTIV